MEGLSCSSRLASRRHATGCGRTELNPMKRARIFQRIECRPPKIETGIELNRRGELDRELWVGRDQHEVFDPKGICCGGDEAAETAHATAFTESVQPGFDLIGCSHADESETEGRNLSDNLRWDRKMASWKIRQGVMHRARAPANGPRSPRWWSRQIQPAVTCEQAQESFRNVGPVLGCRGRKVRARKRRRV
jgi:hypothetical protein